MNIPHSQPWLTAEDRLAVDACLNAGMIAAGEAVSRFESQLADYIGGTKGVATGSGTAALQMCLRALDVGEGDEVILPTYVCRKVYGAITACGATPVLCDIGEEWNMTAETVSSVMSQRTAAIIVVHIFGIPAGDIEEIMNFGFPVIEDACQALGAKLHNNNVGSIGQLSFFSFHATKCLTTGEGGVAVANTDTLAQRLEEVKKANWCPAPMSDMQAALGLQQLSGYSEFLDKRQQLAQRYFTELANCNITLPSVVSNRSIFFRFPVRQRKYDYETVEAFFQRHNIQVRRGVDNLLHWQFRLQLPPFPIAEKMFAETLSLPLYPALTLQEHDRITEIARKLW